MAKGKVYRQQTSCHRRQGCQAWTVVGLSPQYPLMLYKWQI